jgi:hypothetical protein
MACSVYSTGSFSQQAESAMRTIAEWPKENIDEFPDKKVEKPGRLFKLVDFPPLTSSFYRHFRNL